MKRLVCIIFILMFVLPLESVAKTSDSSLKMEELAIQVMPEYSYHPKDTKKNHPPLLIGYQGTFMNQSDKAQKGKIEIPVPVGLKDIQIGYVADYSSDLSEMYEIEYELDKENGMIIWETTNDIQPNDLYKFVIEFYSNEIKVNSESKSLNFTFESFADIGLVNITFLEPLKTDSTKLNPPAESHQENPYGMNMFMYQLSGMEIGDKKSIEINYKRSSSKTTVEIMNQIDPNDEKAPIKPKKVESNELYMVIGGVGVFSLIAAILLVLFLKNKRKNSSAFIRVNSELDLGEDDKSILRARLIQGEISKEEYDKQVRKRN